MFVAIKFRIVFPMACFLCFFCFCCIFFVENSYVFHCEVIRYASNHFTMELKSNYFRLHIASIWFTCQFLPFFGKPYSFKLLLSTRSRYILLKTQSAYCIAYRFAINLCSAVCGQNCCQIYARGSRLVVRCYLTFR